MKVPPHSSMATAPCPAPRCRMHPAPNIVESDMMANVSDTMLGPRYRAWAQKHNPPLNDHMRDLADAQSTRSCARQECVQRRNFNMSAWQMSFSGFWVNDSFNPGGQQVVAVKIADGVHSMFRTTAARGSRHRSWTRSWSQWYPHRQSSLPQRRLTAGWGQ